MRKLEHQEIRTHILKSSSELAGARGLSCRCLETSRHLFGKPWPRRHLHTRGGVMEAEPGPEKGVFGQTSVRARRTPSRGQHLLLEGRGHQRPSWLGVLWALFWVGQRAWLVLPGRQALALLRDQQLRWIHGDRKSRRKDKRIKGDKRREGKRERKGWSKKFPNSLHFRITRDPYKLLMLAPTH